ncbi:MAG: phosphotransferase [Calothrix sp. C42_A2020_038]|nr:phosphotransferase [Calothrix sp. C42_A2020_038]
MQSSEILLTGGKTNLGSIVRVGDTVRRPINSNSTFVHEFLQYLESIKFDASPYFLGMDEQGREVISYIEGEVPLNLGYYSDEQLVAAAKLIRRFHDVTEGCKLAGSEEIVCHNDLSPCNFVFINDKPTSIIDFDMAAPGTRIFDLAYAAWLWLDIGNEEISVNDQKRRLIVFTEAYGIYNTNLLIEIMTKRQSILIEEGHRHQKPCMTKWAQSALEWTTRNLHQ